MESVDMDVVVLVWVCKKHKLVFQCWCQDHCAGVLPFWSFFWLDVWKTWSREVVCWHLWFHLMSSLFQFRCPISRTKLVILDLGQYDIKCLKRRKLVQDGYKFSVTHCLLSVVCQLSSYFLTFIFKVFFLRFFFPNTGILRVQPDV